MLQKGYGPLAPCNTVRNFNTMSIKCTRRLIRSDAAKAFLKTQLPHLSNPTFVDLHCSLNNRDHFQSIIDEAQQKIYPHGTGWQGNDGR
ncbi:hypothetical protein MPER_08333 [Moniliophthora perniciosa FA553]|nr:hypothetical protein MPER_08333 [Moniliophthora perniciosa FA553]